MFDERYYCPQCQKYVGSEGVVSMSGDFLSGPECVWCSNHVLYVRKCDICGKDVFEEHLTLSHLCAEHEKALSDFWDAYLEKHKNDPRVCDIPLLELEKKHYHVRHLLAEHPEWASPLAVLVAGEYYYDSFSSRSCSGVIAGLFGEGYLAVYCGSMSYSHMRLFDNDSDVVRAFDEARAKDDAS